MFHRKYIFLIVIILISIVPLLDLFHPGLPITHDGPDHVIRLANFYQNLSEGKIIPRWAANVNYGYGHPFLIFFYPLSSYVASFFHFFGFTLIDAVKLVFGTSFILSGLAMYLFVKELLNNNKAAFFASMLYIIAPYRFVDLYVRGAIGEHVAFIFPPLIFYFLLKLSKRYSLGYLIGGVLALAGLILSHNAIALMFLPLILIYAFYLIFQCLDKKNFILNVLYLMLLGFGLSAFFWMPALMESKYTLREIVTSSGEYTASFVAWKDFFFGEWSYGGTLALSKQIGIIHWIFVMGSIVAICNLYKKKNKLWVMFFASFLIFWITLFLMTKTSNLIWQTITILQKFQFPWRFLAVTVFLSALMGGFSFSLIANKYKKIVLVVCVVALLLINKDYWHAKDYLLKADSFFTAVQRTTTNDTGESSPIWSVRFMEYKPKAHMEVIDGKAIINELTRALTHHAYAITAIEKSRIRENTLYFPGWEIFVDSKRKDIEFQDPQNRGIMTFVVDKGKHKVDVRFKETKLRLFADFISLITVSSLIGFFSLRFFKKSKKFK